MTSYELLVEELNNLFSQLCSSLNDDSLNYSASIEIFPALDMAGQSIEVIVGKALDKRVVLENFRQVGKEEAVQEISSSIGYAGDFSSHPNLEFIHSNAFHPLRRKLMDSLQLFFLESDLLLAFRFKEGHPFYPVFWDFSFAVEKGENAYVLVGSCSD